MSFPPGIANLTAKPAGSVAPQHHTKPQARIRVSGPLSEIAGEVFNYATLDSITAQTDKVAQQAPLISTESGKSVAVRRPVDFGNPFARWL
jgi:hypothetical protein